MGERGRIPVEVVVRASLEDAWKAFVDPEAVVRWNFASDTWACPRARSDFREGGSFDYRMEARDGTAGFDFQGEYLRIVERRSVEYRLGDGREVLVEFEDLRGTTRVTERFEPESENSLELQRQGWQAILDNYKRHVESVAAL